MAELEAPSERISLLLAEVDGTLVTEDKVLTRRTQQTVEALHAAGIALALTSGRPPRGMAMLVEPLALETPIAGFTGGIVVTPDMATEIGRATRRERVCQSVYISVAALSVTTKIISSHDYKHIRN